MYNGLHKLQLLYSCIPRAAQGLLFQPQWCRSALSLFLPRCPIPALDLALDHDKRCRWSSTPHTPSAQSPSNQLLIKNKTGKSSTTSPSIKLCTTWHAVLENTVRFLFLWLKYGLRYSFDGYCVTQLQGKTPGLLQTAQHDTKQTWHKAAMTQTELLSWNQVVEGAVIFLTAQAVFIMSQI